MKKIVLIVVCLLAAFVANAQNEERKGFKLGIDLGVAQYTNWSALSVFDDGEANQTYGMISSNRLLLGYRWAKNVYLGLGVGFENGNGPKYKETINHVNIIGEFRAYWPITKNIEIEDGISFEYIVGRNKFEYNNKDYTVDHNGIVFALNIGLNYNIDNNNYIGLKAALPCFGNMDKPGLPNEVNAIANSRDTMFGYRLALTYGYTF